MEIVIEDIVWDELNNSKRDVKADNKESVTYEQMLPTMEKVAQLLWRKDIWKWRKMVALTEVCQQENILLNNDIKKIFNFLWDSNYSNPSFATVKESIDNNLSTIFEYETYNNEVHFLNVVGYKTASIGGLPSNYILVADGWHDDSPRYILHNNSRYKATALSNFKIEELEDKK